MKTIAIINGINLAELGTREVNIYGSTDFESYFAQLKIDFPQLSLFYYQANEVEKLAEYLLQCKDFDGIILNPGAFTHTSIILSDTIKNIATKVVEVHLSNIAAREHFRKNSLVGSACVGSISGFGLDSYRLALFFFTSH